MQGFLEFHFDKELDKAVVLIMFSFFNHANDILRTPNVIKHFFGVWSILYGVKLPELEIEMQKSWTRVMIMELSWWKELWENQS